MCRTRKNYWQGCIAAAALLCVGLLAGSSKAAPVTFGTGNLPSSDNVNWPNEPGSTSITGTNNQTLFQVTAGNAGIDLASNNGTAQLTAANANDYFHQLTFTPQAGYGFTEIDWKVDLSGTPATGSNLHVVAVDQNNNPWQGDLPYKDNGGGNTDFAAIASPGWVITSVSFDTDPYDIRDVQHVSIAEAPIPTSVPLPGTAWAGMALLGMIGMVHLRRRLAV